MAPALVKRLVLVGTPLDITPGSMSLLPSELDDRFREALRAGDLERAMHFFVATIVTDPDTGELPSSSPGISCACPARPS